MKRHACDKCGAAPDTLVAYQPLSTSPLYFCLSCLTDHHTEVAQAVVFYLVNFKGLVVKGGE